MPLLPMKWAHGVVLGELGVSGLDLPVPFPGRGRPASRPAPGLVFPGVNVGASHASVALQFM